MSYAVSLTIAVPIGVTREAISPASTSNYLPKEANTWARSGVGRRLDSKISLQGSATSWLTLV
jgi:hypothetical protein